MAVAPGMIDTEIHPAPGARKMAILTPSTETSTAAREVVDVA